jgi:hypothetical protein
VALDGALAEVEPGGDLGVGQSLGYQPRDGEFAFGQAPGRGGWRGAGCGVAAEVLDQPPGDGGGQEGLVGGDRRAPVSCSRVASLSRKPLAPTRLASRSTYTRARRPAPCPRPGIGVEAGYEASISDKRPRCEPGGGLATALDSESYPELISRVPEGADLRPKA